MKKAFLFLLLAAAVSATAFAQTKPKKRPAPPPPIVLHKDLKFPEPLFSDVAFDTKNLTFD